jgi:hypothetical protein
LANATNSSRLPDIEVAPSVQMLMHDFSDKA